MREALTPYLEQPRRTLSRLFTLRVTAQRTPFFFPPDSIPAAPIVGINIPVSTTLTFTPEGLPVMAAADLPRLTMTLVNTRDEQVLTDIPLSTLAYNTGAAPTSFVIRRKEFLLYDIDPLRSYVMNLGALKTLIVPVELVFAP